MTYKSGIVCFIIFCSFIIRLNGQTHNPRLWYLGYQTPLRDTNTIDTGIFLGSGSSVLDFRTNPLSQFRVANTLSIEECNAFIFDDKDSLVLYSNGSKVFNRKHRLIEGADSLNYGANTWANSPFNGNYFAAFYNGLFNQAITILPIPNQKNKYALISIFINGDEDTFKKITYSVIDMNSNGGLGKMVFKEKTVTLGDFTESINAVRHGNGKDWWLIAREYSKPCFTIMLLDSTGIKVVSTNQCNGYNLSNKNAINRNGVNRFSWDGKLFASFTFKGIELYDFNRCNGVLSNRREIHVQDSISFTGGGIFSPDSKLIYTNNSYNLYQIDIKNLSYLRVAKWDGFNDSFGQIPLMAGFSYSQLAPDGKIYYSTSNSFTRYLHRIDNPNVVGLGCNVVQRAVKIQTLNSGIPHFPNFELGTDTCWRSGIEDWKVFTIEVSPNPASDYLFVTSTAPVPTSASVGRSLKLTFTNLLGQQTSPIIENTNQGYRIDVRDLPEGIYIMRLSDKNGVEIQNRKIMIYR